MGEAIPFPSLDGTESLRKRLARLMHRGGGS